MLAAGLPRRIDAEAVVEYFTFQNLFSDRTLFEGVHALPAGCLLAADADGVDVRRWWDYEFDPDGSAFTAGVGRRGARGARGGRRAAARRPTCQSAATSRAASTPARWSRFASRRVPRLMTFTGGFDLTSVEGLELVFDERASAEALSSRFRTEHYEMVMHEGDMA